MEKLIIICVDDQQEVLDAVSDDLEIFETHCIIEECESADEAWDVLDEHTDMGESIALVITDQVMPDKQGTDLMREISDDDRFLDTKRILLTGQATHQDTIEAINTGAIDRYLEKPWKAENLQKVVRELLTVYIVEAGFDYKEYQSVVDSDTLFKALRQKS